MEIEMDITERDDQPGVVELRGLVRGTVVLEPEQVRELGEKLNALAAPPTRRYEVGIRIQSDDWMGVRAALNDLARRAVSDGAPLCSVTAGGSHSYTIFTRETATTHEEYFDELNKWLAAEEPAPEAEEE